MCRLAIKTKTKKNMQKPSRQIYCENLWRYSLRIYRFGRAAYRMVNIKESLACGQLVRLLDLFQSSYCQEHADGRTQGKEVHWLKVQRVVDH